METICVRPRLYIFFGQNRILTLDGEIAMQDELMTVNETAKKLGVSVRSVQRYCKHGLLNHKWIHGKRHRELRIIPPIPLTLLPGVKRMTAAAGEDLVSREEFDELSAILRRELALCDRRIETLERELAQLSPGTGTPVGDVTAPEVSPAGFLERAGVIIDDYERIRPVEKKLILTIARMVKAQEEFFRKLGMEKGKNNPDDENDQHH
jgi:hypothetical protein